MNCVRAWPRCSHSRSLDRADVLGERPRRQRRRLGCTAGSADVWAAPTDPGSPPDVSIPIQSGQCDADVGLQPVMDAKLTCKVPNWKNVALKSAARQLTRADCARGKVTYIF